MLSRQVTLFWPWGPLSTIRLLPPCPTYHSRMGGRQGFWVGLPVEALRSCQYQWPRQAHRPGPLCSNLSRCLRDKRSEMLGEQELANHPSPANEESCPLTAPWWQLRNCTWDLSQGRMQVFLPSFLLQFVLGIKTRPPSVQGRGGQPGHLARLKGPSYHAYLR